MVAVGVGYVKRAADGVFIMLGMVFIGCLHGDFMPGIVGGEGIGLAVGFVDSDAVAHPLVLHLVGIEAVTVADMGGECLPGGAATRDSNAAPLVVTGVVGVILYGEGEGFAEVAPAAVGCFHQEGDGWLCRKVQVLSGFEFECAISRDFKAAVANPVAVRIPCIGVDGGQLANHHAIYAFTDLVGG